MDPLLLYPILACAGCAAGFINTLAGGGSMLTLPLLMLLGLPADVANGTNRLSIVTQSVSGMVGFHRQGKLDTRALVPVVTPAIVGAVIGAWFAANVPPQVLKFVLLGTMIAVAVLMLLFPRAVTAPENAEPRYTWRLSVVLGLFAVGLYGGFIQAGVGFVLLSVLGGLMHYDLVRANALKVACVAIYSAAAMAVFIAADQVRWVPALLLATTTAIGAQLAVRFAVNTQQRTLRAIVVIAVVVICIAVLLRG